MRDGQERLDAVCDLMVAPVREMAGVHRYDGGVQDLSPAGVASGLNRLGHGKLPSDPHDAAHLKVFEEALHWTFGRYQDHRRNPLHHIDALDVTVYDREYAPAQEREDARRQHLAAWPATVDAAVASLDSVPADVAQALLPAAEGLAAGLVPNTAPVVDSALEAHRRFLEHLRRASRFGDPRCAVGEAALATELGVWDGLEIDLGLVASRAESERDRLQELLRAACARIDPTMSVPEVISHLLQDHPDSGGLLTEAAALAAEVVEATQALGLMPDVDGVCLTGPTPPAKAWATAYMNWAAPEEADAPSWYYLTPPGPEWPAQDVGEWLAMFARVTLPAITVHEVSPGHYAHSRVLRRSSSPVRRRLLSMTFAEGWAHYAEEMFAEVGFRAGDPRYQVGMCLEALIRATRLSCSIGLHVGELTVEEASDQFVRHAYLRGRAARAEANRATFDVGFGRYTLGKLAIRDLRDQARGAWRHEFSLRRFHERLLSLGSPPIGLMGDGVLSGRPPKPLDKPAT